MNLFKHLPTLGKKSADDVLTDAEIKAERIQFHRDHVRNGPLKFVYGQVAKPGAQRRAKARATKRGIERQRVRSARLYWAQQQEQAILRSRLQGALVLPSIGIDITQQRSGQDIIWIIERFAKGEDGGNIVVTEQVALEALQSALNRYEAINRLPITFLPEEYELPVAVAA